MIPSKSAYTIFFTLACAFLMAGCSSPEDPVETESTPEIAEGSETVETAPEPEPSRTKTETESVLVAEVGPLKFYLEDVLKLTHEAETITEGTDLDEKELRALKATRHETLSRMIDRRLLILGSAQHPEWVSDASWEEQVQLLFSQMGSEEIERRRTAAGATMEEFEEQFRRFVREEMMIRELVARRVESVTPPTEADMKIEYEKERKETFTRPESWAVYHIDRFIPRDQADSLPGLLQDLDRIRSEVADVIQDATTLKAKAEAMAPFVRKYSEAPDAQVGYAYIYDTTKVNFDSELVDRVRNATLGELSPVFELAGDADRVGASFLLVFENRPGDEVSFETAKRVLKQKMEEDRKNENRDNLFAELERQFPIKRYDENLYSDLPMEGSPQ